MQTGALEPYEESLRTGRTLGLRDGDGRTIELDVPRWLAAVDAADESVLDRCVGPVLDVGCGPGRLAGALGERGIHAVGLDIAETAVVMTRRRGVHAMLRSVFHPLPHEGHWATVLLIDGNIGIGGNPHRLLTRVRALLNAGGRVLVESDEDAFADEATLMRFSQHGEAVGPTFPWARVGVHALLTYAATAGFALVRQWQVDGRTYVELSGR